MANIGTDPYQWSTTAGSNQPDSSDAATVQGDLQSIEAAVKALITPLSSVAGTNTITATATNITAYASGQEFTFIPANTNTGATTINLNSLGAKNVFFGGAACSGGELKQSVPCRIQYDGTQFNIIGPVIGSRLTNSLGADVALNNTGTYFTGPTVAQGTVGTWFASGTVTCYDTAGAGSFDVKLWDGTTVISSCRHRATASSAAVTISLSGYLTTPAGNIRISVKDVSSTSGTMAFNETGNSKDSTISVVRVG